MTKPLISILIPIYNGEKYLEKTLQSIKQQTFKSFEVLLIEDFSTDSSKQIIQTFIDDDKRFILIERTQKGGTAAKGIEYGLPYCKGKFFFYMSQDDFIEDDLLEQMLYKQQETDADVVIPTCYEYYGENDIKKISAYPTTKTQSLTPEEAFYLSLDWSIVGNSLRKMKLVKKIGISADYFNSCEYFGRLNYLYANKIVFCDSKFYYRKNNECAITKGLSWYMIDILKTDIMLYKVLQTINIEPKKVEKRFKEIIKSLKRWNKIIRKKNILFNNKQNNYIKNMYIECCDDIAKICIKNKKIMTLVFVYYLRMRISN